MRVNLNRAYKAKLARAAGVPLDQLDFWFPKALQKLGNVDPMKDAALIAKCMKQMFRSNLKHGDMR